MIYNTRAVLPSIPCLIAMSQYTLLGILFFLLYLLHLLIINQQLIAQYTVESII